KSKLEVIQQKMHDLEKKVNGVLNSKPAHDLRYKKLCLHPRVKLSSGFKIPKFNSFDGHGDPIAHLKDFCSTLVGLENNEPLLMRKLSHESFEEYVMRWRMEASKISHLPNEEELVQTLIRSLDDIYYKTLYFTGIQSFDSVIRIGKELEYGIQSRRIIDEQIHFQVLKNPLDERSKNASTSIPPKQNNQNTEQVHAIFDSSSMRFKPYNSRVSQHKVRKPLPLLP
ncbi:hypothetical protein H5410_062837, partial [Solanum commersonii]